MTRILLTGAGGFVASHLAPFLAQSGFDVVAASRSTPVFRHPRISTVSYPVSGEWPSLLAGIDVVLHLAAVAHRPASEEEHDRVTRGLAAEAAEAARSAGVKQFIFVSSIAAQTGSSADHVVTEADVPRPAGPYGAAKLAAEDAVERSGVPFTVLRPAAIDGPGAKGAVALLSRVAGWPLPLPLTGLDSRRSILSIGNFNTAVAAVLLNPKAIGETFVVADPEPQTVAEVVAQIRAGLGRAPSMFAVPPSWLRVALRLIGRDDLWERLGQPLVISPAKLIAIGWKPSSRA